MNAKRKRWFAAGAVPCALAATVGGAIAATPSPPQEVSFTPVEDVQSLLAAWGPCPGDAACRWDLNDDRQVDAADLALILNGPQPVNEIEVLEKITDSARAPGAPVFGAGRDTQELRREAGLPPLEALNVQGLAPVALPPLQPEDVPDYSVTPVRVGEVVEVGLSSAAGGRWIDGPGNARVWQGLINSPGVMALRLQLGGTIARGGAVFISNADDPNEAYGPYTFSDFRGPSFWSPSVFGPRVLIEYVVPAAGGEDGGEDAPAAQRGELRILAALQRYPDVQNDNAPLGGSCQIDIACDSTWTNEGDGVAHIQFIDGGSGFICSGGILNRTTTDFARTFYTAAHCINTEAVANTIEVYWFFDAASCNGSVPPLNTVPRTVGSTLLGAHNDADSAILGLTDAVPGGLLYLGWDANDAPITAGVSIHHPGGAEKSISYGTLAGVTTSAPCTLGDDCYIFNISNGGQSGGSSGGMVFSAFDSRVRATISCSDSGCSPSESAWEGALSRGYGALNPYLAPSSNVWVDGGYGGNEEGTQAQPFNRIIEGYFGVIDGGTIHIDAGSYPATGVLGGNGGQRAMTLVAENGTVTIGN